MYASRRRFLKASALTGAAMAAGTALGQVNSAALDKGRDTGTPASRKLKIKVAGYRYDRVKGLADGRVPIEK